VFNNDLDFLLNWRKYNKALKHRNALLKAKQIQQINIWNQELLRYGTIVAESRKQYLKQLEIYFTEVCSLFFTMDALELNFCSGWQEGKSFLQSLTESLDKDLRYGYTSNGPHRGDFKLLINNRPAKEFVSRGQLKLLVVALKLAQVKMLDAVNNKITCVLIDDFAAELDKVNRSILLNYLSQLGIQVFITSTDIQDFGDLSDIINYKMFHVEHGKVNQM
jgi:DNA replication and repair protein RecF